MERTFGQDEDVYKRQEQFHGNVAGRTAALKGGYRILNDGIDIEIGDIQPVFLGVKGI